MKRLKKKSIRMMLLTSVLGLTFATAAHAAPINPLENQDSVLLDKREKNVIAELNQIRTQLNMDVLKVNEYLRLSAQSHSNYQYETNENTGHLQQRINSPYFTGKYYYDRTKYFGYDGIAGGESIAPFVISESVALKKMLDAPYHRIGILNPNHKDLGVGSNFHSNKRSSLVLNFGATERYNNDKPVMYPYANQTAVPVSWFENERPNPLETFGKTNIYTGYPITFHFGDANTERFETIDANLRDQDGNVLETYIVDHTANSAFQKHTFIIPKQSLLPNHTYHVAIEGKRVLFSGSKVDVSEAWSFKTVENLKLLEMGVRNNRFEPFYNAGDLGDVTLNINKDGMLFHSYRTINGKTTSFATKQIVEGVYEYTIESPLFNDVTGYISVKKDKSNHFAIEITDEKILEDNQQDKEDVVGGDEDKSTEESPADGKEEEKQEDTDHKENEATDSPQQYPTDTERYKKITLGQHIHPKQTLEINFSGNLLKQSITNDNIFVLDDKGNNYPITLTTIGKKVKIMPKDKYNVGTYTLIIGDGIKGNHMQNISQPALMPFEVKSN